MAAIPSMLNDITGGNINIRPAAGDGTAGKAAPCANLQRGSQPI